jgi:hypothetical protein
MQIMNASALPGNVYDAVYGQVHERVVSTGKWTLEQALDEEVREPVGCERYERGLVPRKPEETRSGTYTRELWTQDGCIFDLRVLLHRSAPLGRDNGRHGEVPPVGGRHLIV